MNILLVNDDGWDAPGLAALELVARQFGEVWSVAPRDKMSGCGHQLTLHRPISIRVVDANHWAMDATPADCVRIALARMNIKFDWVWSGINEGSNLGCDVFRSGTVAAAREAALLGLPAWAISQYQRLWQAPFDWSSTLPLVERAWLAVRGREIPPGRFWNVNLPDLGDQPGSEPPLVFCPLDPNPLPMDYIHDHDTSRYAGRYAERAANPGHDLAVCFSGAISITLV